MKIQSRGFNESIYRDGFMADDMEELPGNLFITNSNIARFYDGEDYEIVTDGGSIRINQPETADAYLELWENYRVFGLPHGQGWINELPWVIDLIKFMERVYNDIEAYRIRTKKWRQT